MGSGDGGGGDSTVHEIEMMIAMLCWIAVVGLMDGGELFVCNELVLRTCPTEQHTS